MAGSRPVLRVIAGTGPGDGVTRKRRFEEAHPDITISLPGTRASLRTARPAGAIPADDYRLSALLDTLARLPGERT